MTKKYHKKCGHELMYHGNAVDFYKEDIQLPNGKHVEWDLIKHPGGACVLPIDDEGNLLLIEQYRNAVDRIAIEVPAGKRDSLDEDYAVCAARELEEETGYRSDHLVLLSHSVPAIGYSNEYLGLFYADHLIPTKQDLDEDEFIMVKRYTLQEALDLIQKDVIVDSKTVISILLYAMRKKGL